MEGPSAAMQTEDSTSLLAMPARIDELEAATPLNPIGTPETSIRGRRRRGRQPTQTSEERAEKKKRSDRNLRKEKSEILSELTKALPSICEVLKTYKAIMPNGNQNPMQSSAEMTNTEELTAPMPTSNGNQNATTTMGNGNQNPMLSPSPPEMTNTLEQYSGEDYVDYNSIFLPGETEYNYSSNDLISSQLTSATTELPNNEPIIQNPESFREISYYDEQVGKFFEQLDSNCKRQVNYSDFNGLEEELSKGVKYNDLPPSLIPIAGMINDVHGDITENSVQSKCAANPTYIMFCAAMKEIHELSLKDVNETKLRVWGEAINNALNINFAVGFAKVHLTKIVQAYFGLKAKADRDKDPELKRLDEYIRELEAKIDSLRKIRQNKISEKIYSECLSQAEYFNGKPLSTGLL